MIDILNLTNGDKLWLLNILPAKELNLREKDKPYSLSVLQL